MSRLKSLVPLWLGYPLLFILGVATGVITVGYAWTKSKYELVPPEIVIVPPPPNATWCFPNTSLKTAIKVRTALDGNLHQDPAYYVADSLKIIAAINQLNDSLRAHGEYPVKILRHNGSRYEVLAQGMQGELTLATEEGAFYLHRIPERFHEKYDSLMQLRYAR